MDISFEDVIKTEGIIFQNDKKYEQAKELFSIFLGYIKTHNFDEALTKKLCHMIVRNSYYDVFSSGYTWKDYDYDTHYMINLRWLYYLITAHKLYPLLYDIDIVKRHFYNCLEYCYSPHTPSIEHYMFKSKKRWFRNRVDDYLKKLHK